MVTARPCSQALYTFTAADAGSHAFAVTLDTAGNQSITATDGAAPGLVASEKGIAVEAAPANSLVVSSFPTTDTAGVAHDVTITAYDPYGNLATGYTGTVELAAATARPYSRRLTFTTADAGTHTFAVTLEHRRYRVDHRDRRADAGLKGSETGITVQAAAARSLVVSGFPTADTAGVAQDVIVTAYDPYGNVATGYTGTVELTSSDGQALLPAATPSPRPTRGRTPSP